MDKKKGESKLRKKLDSFWMALFLTPEGKIYFNEVNTIPGFTAHSRYPGMMKAAGIDFPELIRRLIEMGVGR